MSVILPYKWPEPPRIVRVNEDLARELGIVFWAPLNVPLGLAWTPKGWEWGTVYKTSGAELQWTFPKIDAVCFRGNTAGSGDHVEWQALSAYLASGAEMTIAVRAATPNGGSYAEAFGCGDAGHPRVVRTGSSGVPSVVLGGGDLNASVAWGDGSYHDVVGTKSSGGNKICVDGLVANSQGATSAVLLDKPVSLGWNYVFPTSRCWIGNAGDALIANRPWTPTEVWKWSDPATRWDLYAPIVRRTYVFLGGGATIVSIAKGALGYTGKAAATNARENVGVTKSGVGLSGQNLTVNAREVLAVAKAALSWTGQTATAIVQSAQTVVVGAARFVWSGAALTVRGAAAHMFTWLPWIRTRDRVRPSTTVPKD